MLGVGALLAASAMLFTTLKWIGAPTWSGSASSCGERAASSTHARAPTARPAVRMLGHAWIVTALNPKGLTFFIAFLPQFIDPHADFWAQMLIFEATFVCLAFANAVGYAPDRLAGAILRAERAGHRDVQPRRRRDC